MAFRVETSAEAEADTEEIFDWLVSQHAGEAGMRWFLALEEAIASLATLPERCPPAPENTTFHFEVRQLLYGRRPNVYRILYTIEGDTVYILHIRHGRRKPLRH